MAASYRGALYVESSKLDVFSQKQISSRLLTSEYRHDKWKR